MIKRYRRPPIYSSERRARRLAGNVPRPKRPEEVQVALMLDLAVISVAGSVPTSGPLELQPHAASGEILPGVLYHKPNDLF